MNALRFAGAATIAGLAVLSSPANAAATGDGTSRGGVTAVAHATATIAEATEVRAEELLALGDRYIEAEGLAVRPIGVSRRDCANGDAESRCALIVLDMP
jgi:hypothetical protein